MNPLAADLDHVLAHTTGLWEELRGQRIFISGGTGFFGCWLLESFVWANDRLDLGAKALVLTRNVEAFRKKAPHLASHPTIQFQPGDVRSFEFPEGQFSHVLHAATEASAKLNAEDPRTMFDTIVGGTRHTLDFAAARGAKKFLLTSSGAVYGRQPSELTHIPEDYGGGPEPTDPRWAYGEGKRAAEMLCTLYAKRHGLEPKLARCFAFVGPYLPLDAHFAIGNFIRDGLKGGPIQVNDDGTPFRSYLYAADLAIWLWTILFRGQSGRPYNVGSEDDRPIAVMANAVAKIASGLPVTIGQRPQPGSGVSRYVPRTRRAADELGLQTWISLEDGLTRTWNYHRRQP